MFHFCFASISLLFPLVFHFRFHLCFPCILLVSPVFPLCFACISHVPPVFHFCFHLFPLCFACVSPLFPLYFPRVSPVFPVFRLMVRTKAGAASFPPGEAGTTVASPGNAGLADMSGSRYQPPLVGSHPWRSRVEVQRRVMKVMRARMRRMLQDDRNIYFFDFSCGCPHAC